MSEAPDIHASQPQDSPDNEADERASELPRPPDSPQTAPVRRGATRHTGWLVLLLLVAIAGVTTSPFWAPQVMPLLPWTGDEQTLATRLAALEKQNAAAHAELAGLRAAQDTSSRRLARNEAVIAGLGRRLDTVAAQSGSSAGLEAKLTSLGRRLDAIAARPAADPATLQKLQQDVASLATKLAGFGRRLDTIAARPGIDPAALQKLQQDVAGLDKRAGDLTNQVAALETRIAARPHPAGKETALLLALLQMRDKIEKSQPFAAQYDAFATLAQGRPELVTAAAPLAPLAKSGIASRAALAHDLSRIADSIAAASPAAAAGSGTSEDWSAQVLDQLHRLVTIRRLDGGRQTPAEAAVAHAEADLTRGDLAAAVATLQTVSGPSATAAQPWLAAARQRLTAETALSRLQQMLAARALQKVAPASSASAPQPEAGRL